MDDMMLENSQEFFQSIDQCSRVRGVIWGHTHQQFESKRGHVKMMGSPSTCVQFKPGSTSYEKDVLSAGFRKLFLHANGKIESRVYYLNS